MMKFMMITMRSRGIGTFSGVDVLIISFTLSWFSFVLSWFSFGFS